MPVGRTRAQPHASPAVAHVLRGLALSEGGPHAHHVVRSAYATPATVSSDADVGPPDAPVGLRSSAVRRAAPRDLLQAFAVSVFHAPGIPAPPCAGPCICRSGPRALAVFPRYAPSIGVFHWRSNWVLGLPVLLRGFCHS